MRRCSGARVPWIGSSCPVASRSLVPRVLCLGHAHEVVGAVGVAMVRAVSRVVWSASMVITRPARGRSAARAQPRSRRPSWKLRVSGSCVIRVIVTHCGSRREMAIARASSSLGIENRCSAASICSGSTDESMQGDFETAHSDRSSSRRRSLPEACSHTRRRRPAHVPSLARESGGHACAPGGGGRIAANSSYSERARRFSAWPFGSHAGGTGSRRRRIAPQRVHVSCLRSEGRYSARCRTPVMPRYCQFAATYMVPSNFDGSTKLSAINRVYCVCQSPRRRTIAASANDARQGKPPSSQEPGTLCYSRSNAIAATAEPPSSRSSGRGAGFCAPTERDPPSAPFDDVGEPLEAEFRPTSGIRRGARDGIGQGWSLIDGSGDGASMRHCYDTRRAKASKK